MSHIVLLYTCTQKKTCVLKIQTYCYQSVLYHSYGLFCLWCERNICSLINLFSTIYTLSSQFKLIPLIIYKHIISNMRTTLENMLETKSNLQERTAT